MPGNFAALAKRSAARAQQRAQSRRAREEAAATAGEVSVSGSSSSLGSSFATVTANARRKLGHKNKILAVDGAGKPYPKSALLCLALNNPLRQAAIRTIRWPGSSMIDPPPASSPRSHGRSALAWLGQSSARYTRLSAGRRGTPAQLASSLTTQPRPPVQAHPAACRHHWQCLIT